MEGDEVLLYMWKVKKSYSELYVEGDEVLLRIICGRLLSCTLVLTMLCPTWLFAFQIMTLEQVRYSQSVLLLQVRDPVGS